MIKKSWRWFVVLSIVTIIYYLSDIPDLHLVKDDQLPLWLKELGSKYVIKFGTTGYFSYEISLHPDYVLHKIGHVMVFGILGAVIYWSISYSVRWAIVLTALIATLDEWHQYFVPGRSSRFGDVVLDMLAAITFIVIVKMIKRK